MPSRTSTTSPRAAALTAGLAAAAALMMGGCSASLPEGGLFTSATTTAPDGKTKAAEAVRTKTELQKALEYWGKQHQERPTDLKAALSYARNLKAAGRKEDALGVMQAAAIVHGNSRELASEYGRLALDLGQLSVAERLLVMADDPSEPDWRLISARGTLLAKQGNYADAVQFYERALELSPGQVSVQNNLAMAYAASGEPAKAEGVLRKIASADADPKVRQNLALVLGLQGKHDDAKVVAADLPSPVNGEANVEYVKRMVKAQPDKPAVIPAVATQPAPAAAPARKPVIEAKAAAPAVKGPMRATQEPEAGTWATSVARAR